MTVLNITMPDDLESFVSSEARARGYSSPAEYVRAVMEALRQGKSHAALEKTLVERLDGPAAIDLTPAVWAALQQRVHARLEKLAG